MTNEYRTQIRPVAVRAVVGRARLGQSECLIATTGETGALTEVLRDRDDLGGSAQVLDSSSDEGPVRYSTQLAISLRMRQGINNERTHHLNMGAQKKTVLQDGRFGAGEGACS